MPLEFNKTHTYLRLYFNHRNDFPNVWSVDDGDPANEVKVAEVVIEGIGLAKFNGEARKEYAPVAWIEFPSAKCWIVGGIMVITNAEAS